MLIKYSLLLSSSLIALTYANHVLASPLNSTPAHTYIHNTVELKPIADLHNSFNIAALQYLPDFVDSEYGWAGSKISGDYSRGDCKQTSSLYTTRNCSYPRAVVASSKCAMMTGYYRECACLPQFKLASCTAPKYPSSPSCNGKFETCLCPATVTLSYTNDRCTAYCDGKCITKSCTPTPGETGCKYGAYSVTNNCGGTRSVCYADNCRNRTAVSTPYGCQSYFSDCSSKCQAAYADNCRNRTATNCTYGCKTSFSDCSSKCQTCYTDNCRNRTAVSTPYGCQTYFSDCSSKCQTAYADNCRNRTAANCTYGCKTSFSDCSSKCQTCYTDNCRNRTAVSTPYGCQTYFSDCSSKCQTAYADNCRNRNAVIASCPANASCSYFSDCSSKISSWSCNSGYTKSGNSCVESNPCPGYSKGPLYCKYPDWIRDSFGIPEKVETCSSNSVYQKCVVDGDVMSKFVRDMKSKISMFQQFYAMNSFNGRPCQDALVMCTSGNKGMYWGVRQQDAVEIYIYYSKHITADGTPQLKCSDILRGAATGCSGSFNEPSD